MPAKRSKLARAGVPLLVSAAMVGAGVALGFAAAGIRDAFADHPARSLAFLGASILLQLFAVRLPGPGSVSVSAVGIIGAAIALGTGPAMAIGVAVALAQWARTRAPAYRALFDASNLALSAGAAGVVFDQVAGLDGSGVLSLLAALAAGFAYSGVNFGLLCLAMGSSEGRSAVAVWLERFHWARFHFLAFGALGLLAATADAQLGAVSLVAFVVPPILLALSMRGALARFRLKSA
jgi:hypothetical protein